MMQKCTAVCPAIEVTTYRTCTAGIANIYEFLAWKYPEKAPVDDVCTGSCPLSYATADNMRPRCTVWIDACFSVCVFNLIHADADKWFKVNVAGVLEDAPQLRICASIASEVQTIKPYPRVSSNTKHGRTLGICTKTEVCNTL
jgi:hypothetical protein